MASISKKEGKNRFVAIKNVDVRAFDDVPYCNELYKEKNYNPSVLRSVVREKLCRGIEYERNFQEEHNFKYIPLNLCVTHSSFNGITHSFLNGYYVTPYGNLYSVTDEYGDTYGHFEEELTREVLSLMKCINDAELIFA